MWLIQLDIIMLSLIILCQGPCINIPPQPPWPGTNLITPPPMCQQTANIANNNINNPLGLIFVGLFSGSFFSFL